MKGDPAKDEGLLTQARTLVEVFEHGVNNYGADTLAELKAMLQPILGDEDGHGDSAMDRLLVRLQQSPRCDDAMREDIARVRSFVAATPPKKLRGNRKLFEQARALASLAVYATTAPETGEPTAPETTVVESETPSEPEAEVAEAALTEATPSEAAELCNYCHEPGHTYNNCPHNQGPDYREEVIAETEEIERERA